MMPVSEESNTLKFKMYLPFLLLAVSWLPFATGYLGTFYLIVSSSLGAVFIYFAFALNFDEKIKKPFHFSLFIFVFNGIVYFDALDRFFNNE